MAYDLRCGIQCGISVQHLESYSQRSPREYDCGFNLRDQLHKLRKLSVGFKKRTNRVKNVITRSYSVQSGKVVFKGTAQRNLRRVSSGINR